MNTLENKPTKYLNTSMLRMPVKFLVIVAATGIYQSIKPLQNFTYFIFCKFWAVGPLYLFKMF